MTRTPPDATSPFDAWTLIREEATYSVYEHDTMLYGAQVTLREWVPHDPVQTTVRTRGTLRQELAPPIVIASGWCLSPEPYYHQARALAALGRRVTTFDSPHGVDLDETVLVQYKNIPPAELRRMLVLLDVIEHHNRQSVVDVIAHSEGAFYTALAADIHPEYFRSIIFQAPSGITTAHDTKHSIAHKVFVDVPDLAVSYTRELLGHIVHAARTKDDVREAIQLAFGNSWFNMAHDMKSAWASVWALSDADIRDVIRRLQSEGIRITIMAAEDDVTFPLEELQEKGEDLVLNMIVMADDVHNAVLTESQAPEYAHTVADILRHYDSPQLS